MLAKRRGCATSPRIVCGADDHVAGIGIGVLRWVEDCNTMEGDSLILERIEWDDANLKHATVLVSAAEIEHAIWNAGRMSDTGQSAIGWSSDREPMAVGHSWSLPS